MPVNPEKIRALVKARYGAGRARANELLSGPLAPFVRAVVLPWRLFKVLTFCLGLIVMAAGGATYVYVNAFVRSFPDVEHMTMKDLQELGHKRVDERLVNKRAYYHWVELNEISRGCLYSIVTSEDATFFEHDGFNYDAIMDSLAENIRERKPAFGASTISQQVVKNLFLGNEKTLVRKFREFLITRAVERHFTKNQILEAYLNVAEFGPDIFGVDAAARHFFGRPPVELNAAQGAFLGLMLPSPRRNYFSIWQNKNLTKVKHRRLERVLRDMLYEEYITEAQYHQYTKFHFFPEKGNRMPAHARRAD